MTNLSASIKIRPVVDCVNCSSNQENISFLSQKAMLFNSEYRNKKLSTISALFVRDNCAVDVHILSDSGSLW